LGQDIAASDSVSAILLASGRSKRFGEADKLLFPFRGKPLARHTLDLVCSAQAFSQIIFVAASGEVAAVASGLPVTVIMNRHPERGQRESIRLGVEAAEAERGGAGGFYMFFPCDQPLLDRETVRRVLDARKRGAIVRPCHDGASGSPALFCASFRDELVSLRQGEHGRDIILRRPSSLVLVEASNPAALTDIDSMGDADPIYSA
jgi:molybdenum cofactor cytidylyltransferase